MLAVESVRDLFAIRFKPGRDLAAVLISWLLVTGSLYVATFVIGAKNGIAYFLAYGIVTAAICGVGLPLAWTAFVRKRPVSDLGLTKKFLGASILIQLVLAAGQYAMTLAKVQLPPTGKLVPLVALVLCIGFFEAVFWRGWVFTRLEEMFGFLPALVVGSALYAVYHIGYGMTWSEMTVLFWVGVFYACTFRLTRNVFILWPLLQPLGQLFTLSKAGLDLPLLAAVGFGEVFVAMLVMIWFSHRSWKRHAARKEGPTQPASELDEATV
jgi:uncharacterized protein